MTSFCPVFCVQLGTDLFYSRICYFYIVLHAFLDQDVHGGEGGHVLLKLPQTAGTARADNSKKQAEDDHMDEDDKDEDEDEESKLVIEDDV